MFAPELLKRLKNANKKVKTLKKMVSHTSLISKNNNMEKDDIIQKSIQLVSNGKKTKVDIYARNNDDVNRKSMQFDNNKTNLAKLLKVDPVFGDLDTRLYNDFLKNGTRKTRLKKKGTKKKVPRKKWTNKKRKKTRTRKR